MDKNIDKKKENLISLKISRRFLMKAKNQLEKFYKLNLFQIDVKEDINKFKLSKIKRYHLYDFSDNVEIIDYCNYTFNIKNQNDITLDEFKKLIIKSFENISNTTPNSNLKKKKNLNYILEDFENKIIIALQKCKYIHNIIKIKKECNINKNNTIKEMLNINNNNEKKLNLPNDVKEKIRCYHLSRLLIYVKIINSLKDIIPSLTKIINSVNNVIITPEGCGIGCSISGGKINYIQ